jgi:DNA-binding MarR family transcriptional regulator
MQQPAEQAEPTLDPPPLGFLVASVGQQAMSAFRAHLQPHGLHPRAFAVLWTLLEADDSEAPGADGQSQQDLSRSLRIPASRLVGVIDDLEEGGLVVREAHPTDRRAHTVRLTGPGREATRTLIHEAARFDQQLNRGLSPADRTRLRHNLLAIAANLQPEGSPGSPLVW